MSSYAMKISKIALASTVLLSVSSDNSNSLCDALILSRKIRAGAGFLATGQDFQAAVQEMEDFQVAVDKMYRAIQDACGEDYPRDAVVPVDMRNKFIDNVVGPYLEDTSMTRQQFINHVSAFPDLSSRSHIFVIMHAKYTEEKRAFWRQNRSVGLGSLAEPVAMVAAEISARNGGENSSKRFYLHDSAAVAAATVRADAALAGSRAKAPAIKRAILTTEGMTELQAAFAKRRAAGEA